MTLWATTTVGWLDAAAWTWVATLVQMSVVAAAAGCCCRLLAAPAARHRVWCGAMAATTGLAAATFAALVSGHAPAAVAWRVAAWGAGPTTGPASRAVVLAWLAGAAIGLLYVAAGRLRLSRRRRAAGELPARWRRTVEEVRQACGVRAEVRCSRDVEGPATFGWRRPVVLLPADAPATWTPAQLRMVLAHEFEHVRRRDYLWNLGQALWEALFFFHPATWQVGAAARREREYCCDDRAVAVAAGPAAYVRALTELETARPSARLAPAMGGALLDRSARLLGRRAPRRRSAWLLAAGMLAATATGAACGERLAAISPPPAERLLYFCGCDGAPRN